MSAHQQKILDEIQALMTDLFDEYDGKVGMTTTAEDIEQWDSLANVQLMVRLEQRFKIKFTAAEITSLAHVGELVTLIGGKLPA
jgi:acyl carrier protein